MNFPHPLRTLSDIPSLLVAACVLLFAAVLSASGQTNTGPREQSDATETASPFFDQLGPPFKSQLRQVTRPMIGMVASASVVNLCPGGARVRLTASGFDPAGRQFGYRWAASGGRIEAGGREAVWDLAGVAPGSYRASVTLEVGGGRLPLAEKTVGVIVRACPAPRVIAACPYIGLCCRESITLGEPLPVSAEIGATPGAPPPAFAWTLSNGRIITGQGTQAIEVDTRGAGGQSIVTTFEARVYGLRCSSSCVTRLLPPKPVPTPYPTPVTTPSPRPTPSLAPSPTPSPSPSPTPSPTPTPEPLPQVFPLPPLQPPRVKGDDYIPPPVLVLAIIATLSLLAYLLWTYGGSLLSAIGIKPVNPEAAAGAPEEVSDEVLCSLFAPRGVPAGDEFSVVAFAHLAEHASLLLEKARESDDRVVSRGSDEELDVEIVRGRELTFHLDMPGLVIDNPSQSFIWKGKLKKVPFGVKVPETFAPARINCQLGVCYEGVAIGRIKFNFEVTPAAVPAPAAAATAPVAAQATVAPQAAAAPPAADDFPIGLEAYRDFRRYRRAFISYASEDRPEVMRSVQAFRLAGIYCYQDVLELMPGDRWEKNLYKYIDDSDVVYLFWSEAAHRSEWVKREVLYALESEARGDTTPPDIIPYILQGPPEVPAPDYLPDRHFNDPIVCHIRDSLAARAAKQNKAREAEAAKE